MLEWTDISSFHAFYPKSPQFSAFVNIVKPFLTGPAAPELYETSSAQSTSSVPITQIIRVKQNGETEEAWQSLQELVRQSATSSPRFRHAKGIEKDGGNFLGLIGWEHWEVCTGHGYV